MVRRLAAVVLSAALVGVHAVAGLVPVVPYQDICTQVSGALGYPCNHHTVLTEDGFLLDVIHIPPAAGPNASLVRDPVVLQHGLGDSAVTFGWNAHPSRNLACRLHDLGYDVWMPNSRANAYSMENVHFPEPVELRNETYWRLTDMDYMAKYDLPAVIDYVLHQTNASQLAWVGHSQGTWQAFSAFSTTRREYAAKVSVFVALAPVCWVRDMTSLMWRWFAALADGEWFELFGTHMIAQGPNVEAYMRELWCDGNEFPDDACMELWDLAYGYGNNSNINQTQLIPMSYYSPAGTSDLNMIHWNQEIRQGTYAMHDFGPVVNEELYGQMTPPAYNLSAMVDPPTVLISGSADSLADPTDVARIVATVPAGTIRAHHVVDGYAHMDFVRGLDAAERVHPLVIDALERYGRQ